MPTGDRERARLAQELLTNLRASGVVTLPDSALGVTLQDFTLELIGSHFAAYASTLLAHEQKKAQQLEEELKRVRFAKGVVQSAYDEASPWAQDGPLWKERAESAERSAERLAEAAEKVLRPENHSPCRSGGMDEDGVCPNVCMCDWAEQLRTALASYREQRQK